MILLQVSSNLLFVIAITVAMIIVIAFFSIYLFLLFQKRKIHLLQQQQQMQEKAMLQAEINARDETMKNVGRELHDHIGQMMTVIKMNLELLVYKSTDPVELERLHTTKGQLTEVIRDIRLLSKTLNGELIQQLGLLESIRHEIDRLNKLSVIGFHLETSGEIYPINSHKEFVIFRIIQENLNNILKHAACKNVFTSIEYDVAKLCIRQKDDGVGFDPAILLEGAEKSGSGILNMMNRAQQIGATIKFDTRSGGGTTLELSITDVK